MKEESRHRIDPSESIRRHLERVKVAIIENMTAYDRHASFKHRDSLKVDVTASGGILWGLWSFNVMETGRKGGKVPYNFVDIIRQWILDKGLAIRPIPYKTKRPHKYEEKERGLNTMAYLISRKIMKKGTSLYRAGIRQDIYSGIINRECEAIASEVGIQVGQIISNINKNA